MEEESISHLNSNLANTQTCDPVKVRENSGLVREGYKMTKLGWIPEVWEVVKFNKIASFNPKSDSLPESFIYIDLESVKDGILQKRTILKKEDAPSRAQRLLKKNDVLFQTVRPYQKNNLFFQEEGDFVASTGYAQIRAKYNSRFIFHLIQVTYFNNQVLARCTGTSFPAISAKDLSNVLIKLPTLPEQQKIATILSSWDTAIAKQQQLIAAKQEFKKGLMQLLLTGEKRFAGFEGEWERKALGGIGMVIRGASPRPKGDPKYYGGNVPRLMVQDVTRDGKYVTPKIDFLTELGATKSRPCKKGTLTIVCSGEVGTPSFLAVDACIHDGFLAIINIKKNVNMDFLYNQMLRLKSRLERDATHGGVFTNLTTTILKDFILSFPEIAEQQKIASILGAADKEIDLLKKELSELQGQKRGLMQQLLTGEVRIKI